MYHTELAEKEVKGSNTVLRIEFDKGIKKDFKLLISSELRGSRYCDCYLWIDNRSFDIDEEIFRNLMKHISYVVYKYDIEKGTYHVVEHENKENVFSLERMIELLKYVDLSYTFEFLKRVIIDKEYSICIINGSTLAGYLLYKTLLANIRPTIGILSYGFMSIYSNLVFISTLNFNVFIDYPIIIIQCKSAKTNKVFYDDLNMDTIENSITGMMNEIKKLYSEFKRLRLIT